MPEKPEVHSPEAVNYAFTKAIELLVVEGFGETADILFDCKPRGVAQNQKTRCENCNLLARCDDPLCPNVRAQNVQVAWLVKWVTRLGGPQASAYITEREARRAASNIESYADAKNVEVMPAYAGTPAQDTQERMAELQYEAGMYQSLYENCQKALAAALAHPSTESDVRWAVNVLLEKIAEKFEGWDTMDIWRSDAASTVRGFKHDLGLPVPSTMLCTPSEDQSAPISGVESCACHFLGAGTHHLPGCSFYKIATTFSSTTRGDAT